MNAIEGALKLYGMGYKVFPVLPGDKKPVFEGWQRWAETATKENILQYHKAHPNTNWGVSCAHQLAVIDVDKKNDKDGMKTLKEYEAKHGKLPPTFTVETPSGGQHRYYSGQIKQDTDTLGPGLDTRSMGGLVVAPGSVTGGKPYTILYDRPILPLPSWVKPNGKLNKPLASVSEKVENSIDIGSRDKQLTRYAGLLRGVVGLTTPEIDIALSGIDSIRCTSSLGKKEITKIAKSIGSKPTNEAKALADFTEVADVDLMKKEKDWPIYLKDFMLGKAPDREWVIPEWMPKGEISSLYGSGSAGKSLLTIQMGLAICTGSRFMGIDIGRSMPFIGIYCEDSKDEVWRRLDSIRSAPEYAFVKEDDDYCVWPRVGKDNALVKADSKGDVVVGPFMPKLRAFLKTLKVGPRFIVLDTLSDIYMGDENTREKVNKVIKVHVAAMAAEFDLTVLLLAHPSRTGMGTGDMLSGSTAWENAVRNRLSLESDKEGLAILKRLKSNYACKDEEGIKMVWNKGRFTRLAYGSLTDELKQEIKQLTEFLPNVCKGTSGRIGVPQLQTQLITSPRYGHLINRLKSTKYQREKIIKLFKCGIPIHKDIRYEYTHELKGTKAHWITWKHEVDILS